MDESNHNQIIVFLFQIGVMLAVGLASGQLMRKLRQPAVLGELIGGIVIGPTILGVLLPNVYNLLFPIDTEIIQARETIIIIGMLFFMFVAGLEVNLSQLKRKKRNILFISILGCLLPFGFGVASNFLFPGIWESPAKHESLNFTLFIGIALSISALPVITRILMDLRLLHKELGGIVITSATINDLIGWTLFALLLGNLSAASSENNLVKTLSLTFIFSVLILGVGRWIGRPLFQWARNSLVWPSGFLGVSAVFIFISAATAEILNIHAIFGAFLVGVALYPAFEQNDGASQAKEIIHQFAISLFAPLYFVSVGLKANFAASFDPQLVLFVIGVATIGKVAGAGLGARVSGMDFKDALTIGFAMNARGAMEMILATIALEYQLIDERIFVALITMALVTSLLSAPMLQWLLKLPNPNPTG